jgi:hypothetical protein
VKVLRFVLALAIPLIAASPDIRKLSTEQKIELIEKEQAPSKSEIIFNQSELNAYIVRKLPEVAPQGVRNTKLELYQGKATGYAIIDFPKLRRHSQGDLSDWFLRKLIGGERPVTVVASLKSSGGMATVDVQSVEINGRTISGRSLDLLIDMFVLPLYPEAKIGEPFELNRKVDHIEVAPGAARVYMR